jgi:hypothetical protein
MPLFEMRANRLLPVLQTSFAAEGLKERADLQRLLKDHIESLEEGLLILTEEFGDWADSQRRIDLLCLDQEAKLVVVELKRDESGGHMELQALRYAAMVSTMTFDQAAQTLAHHRNRTAPDVEAARTAIIEFLGWTSPTDQPFAEDTRIILAAADFSKELTTTVLWLREREIDVRCIRLRPYRLDAGPLLLNVEQIIPLPETAEFVTQIQEKRAKERPGRSERLQPLEDFLNLLAERASERTSLHRGRRPNPIHRTLPASTGTNGLSLNYVVGALQSRVELLFQGHAARERLPNLTANRQAIDASFGGRLEWPEEIGPGQFRIANTVDGGYRSPEGEWPAIHENLIDAMIRFEAAIRPVIQGRP